MSPRRPTPPAEAKPAITEPIPADGPAPVQLVRRRDARTGVVIRVAPTHPFATDNGWATITNEKSAS